MRFSGRSGMRSPWSCGVARQLEPERGAAAGAVVEADAALHQLDQPLADREAEPGAALLPGGGGVGLREAAEDAAAELLRDAAAAVVHPDAHAGPGVLGADLDHAALGRELGRV